MDHLIEILSILTRTLLSGAILSVCWNLYFEMRFDKKSEDATFFTKILTSNGASTCGWLYLLRYRDTVASHFTVLSIILSLLSVAVVVFTVVTTYKKLRHVTQKDGE